MKKFILVAAIAANATAAQANRFTQLFEYVKNALCTSYLFLLLAIIVVLKQLFESDSDRFIREMHEKQREEQLNTEFQRMVAEQAAIDRAIGRRV